MRRFVFAPRWVLGHVLILVAVASCMLLARWQWDVSQHTHSLQNLAYALQWPLFGVFFAVMWYRMLRLESEKLDEDAEDAEPEPSAGSGPAEASEGPNPSPGAVDVAAESGRPEPSRRPRRERSRPPVVAPLLAPLSAPPAPRAAAPAEADDEDDADQLAAYNRMLAELAARDSAG